MKRSALVLLLGLCLLASAVPAAAGPLRVEGVSPSQRGRDTRDVITAPECSVTEHTWLEFADLVFVDPVGTGFSRPGPGVDARQFYEVQRDIEVAADFVRLFVTQRDRWLSPQYLVGESYGTARAVGMAGRLQDRYGLYVSGLILLSSALNLGVISFDPGNIYTSQDSLRQLTDDVRIFVSQTP